MPELEQIQGNVELGPGGIEDVPGIVALHTRTFNASQHLGVWFGAQYLSRMYHSAVREQSFVLLKATQDGRLIGFTSARVGGYYSLGVSQLDLQSITHALLNLRCMLSAKTFRRLAARHTAERRLRQLRREPYAQEFITCVSTESRKLGVGSRLRQRMYEECRLLGAEFLYTGVAQDNVDMLSISKRDGFRELFRDRLGLVVHLVKDLGPAEGGETVPKERQQDRSTK